MLSLSGKTQVVGIIGNPIRHSLSPAMQNAAFEACNLDYVYVPFAVAPEKLGEAVSGLCALSVCGFNVTIPHKVSIIRYLDELDRTAEDAGAVNTVLVRDGRMTGFNTDGDGLVCSLAEDLDFSPGVAPIVIIGAGGAARGAVAALCRAGAQQIVIVNRSYDNSCTLKEEMNLRYPGVRIEAVKQNQLGKKHLVNVSLLINTTSLGMNGERMDFLDLAALPSSAKVYDMVYSPAITPLMSEAAEKGIAVSNGLGMLAAQGERAFTVWTGQIPPKGLMKRVLLSTCRP
ncbi:MAG: shikimate dehydrogenase [Steroidobacteraceae bacterium]|nr:shikimate dehydrogenase [Deltaproteobacteria bacterium]